MMTDRDVRTEPDPKPVPADHPCDGCPDCEARCRKDLEDFDFPKGGGLLGATAREIAILQHLTEKAAKSAEEIPEAPVSDSPSPIRAAIQDGLRAPGAPSQAELARAIGLDETTLSKFLHGRRDLPQRHLDALLRELRLVIVPAPPA